MATVRLSDVFIPAVYGSYTALNSPETTALFQSGIIRSNPVITAIALGGGIEATVPFWQDLDASGEPNYSNDDPEDHAVPDKIGTGSMRARKAFVNKGYASMDLVTELLNAEPLQQIRNRFGIWWERQLQHRTVAMAVGIMNTNVAKNAGDMTIDISANVGDDAVFGSNAFIDAAFTAGDAVGMFTAIAVHSMIHARMVKNDDVIMIPDSEGNLTIPTYKGRRIIVDDGLPVAGGVYTSILMGGGAFGFGGVEGHAFAIGEGDPKVPAAVVRDETSGNGGGGESIWERRTWLLHPFGHTWLEGGAAPALTEFSPTLADLRLAGHWERIAPRKSVPLAFIKSRANAV